MWRKTLSSFENYSLDDLHQIKDHLDMLIKKKNYEYKVTTDKRSGQRAHVKIPGKVEIEREKEFFDQTYKVTIREMSINGMILTVPATVIVNDILAVTFRLPSNGERKVVDCQVMRVKNISSKNDTIFEVAAKFVGKKVVKDYRHMLKKRGQ